MKTIYGSTVCAAMHNEGSRVRCPEKQQTVTNTASEREDNSAADVQCQFRDKIKPFVAFSNVTNENAGDESCKLLADCIRGVNEDFPLVRELLESVSMEQKQVLVNFFLNWYIFQEI